MRTIHKPKTISVLTDFIKTTVSHAGFTDVIVAVSGGVDSAVSISLAVRALGAEHVHALLLPYKDWHDEAKTHAHTLLKQLQLPQDQIHEVDIAPLVHEFENCLEFGTCLPAGEAGNLEFTRVRIGNVMARVRMIVLFDYAKKLGCLVQGTENKSEHYLGYFTRFGDEASDLEPLRTLYKSEVYQLAKQLQVPQEIIQKPASAGLWQDQTDEGQFGFTYAQADEVLYLHFDQKLPLGEIATQTKLDNELVNKILSWCASMDFKHSVPHLPPEPVL
ncbi:NAD+ synthase [Candidatus Microgenomates bacterium]|nr:MAG: NAD+ synthase [Candidatus Microgenomates bacterium]